MYFYLEGLAYLQYNYLFVWPKNKKHTSLRVYIQSNNLLITLTVSLNSKTAQLFCLYFCGKLKSTYYKQTTRC